MEPARTRAKRKRQVVFFLSFLLMAGSAIALLIGELCFWLGGATEGQTCLGILLAGMTFVGAIMCIKYDPLEDQGDGFEREEEKD